jgi:hypothetical protein
LGWTTIPSLKSVTCHVFHQLSISSRGSSARHWPSGAVSETVSALGNWQRAEGRVQNDTTWYIHIYIYINNIIYICKCIYIIYIYIYLFIKYYIIYNRAQHHIIYTYIIHIISVGFSWSYWIIFHARFPPLWQKPRHNRLQEALTVLQAGCLQDLSSTPAQFHWLAAGGTEDVRSAAAPRQQLHREINHESSWGLWNKVDIFRYLFVNSNLSRRAIHLEWLISIDDFPTRDLTFPFAKQES